MIMIKISFNDEYQLRTVLYELFWEMRHYSLNFELFVIYYNYTEHNFIYKRYLTKLDFITKFSFDIINSSAMNNNYFSSPINEYSTSYDYSYNYISPPTTSSFTYSPMAPTSCPVHSPYNFYTTVPSMNVSPLSYSYYPQEQQPVPTQVYFSSPVEQSMYFQYVFSHSKFTASIEEYY